MQGTVRNVIGSPAHLILGLAFCTAALHLTVGFGGVSARIHLPPGACSSQRHFRVPRQASISSRQGCRDRINTPESAPVPRLNTDRLVLCPFQAPTASIGTRGLISKPSSRSSCRAAPCLRRRRPRLVGELRGSGIPPSGSAHSHPDQAHPVTL